jgi:anti-anti-sigma factor
LRLDVIFKHSVKESEQFGDVMQLLIGSQKKNGHYIFFLSGDLNYEGACKLKNAFNEALNSGETLFILNLEGLKIISSHALSTILKISYLAKKKNGTVKVVCPEGNVWDVFYVLELGKVVPLFSTENELWAAQNSALPASM